MRVAQKKRTFARTVHQSLNSNPKTLRQRKTTDNNRREPQRPLLDRIICAKTELQVAWVSCNLYFFVSECRLCYSDSARVSVMRQYTPNPDFLFICQVL